MRDRAPVLEWLKDAPPGARVIAAALTELLQDCGAEVVGDAGSRAGAEAASVPVSWRERVHTCHPETRMRVADVADALGWSEDKVYRHTSEKVAAKRKEDGLPDVRLPFRRDVAGTIVFVAAEVLAWLAEHEEQVNAPPRPFAERLKVVGDN